MSNVFEQGKKDLKARYFKDAAKGVVAQGLLPRIMNNSNTNSGAVK